MEYRVDHHAPVTKVGTIYEYSHGLWNLRDWQFDDDVLNVIFVEGEAVICGWPVLESASLSWSEQEGLTGKQT